MSVDPQSAREWYEDGVAEHYQSSGAQYVNPHEPVIHELISRFWPGRLRGVASVMDLCGGSGELTRAMLGVDGSLSIVGVDPFTHVAYERETGRPCRRFGFDDIAAGRAAFERFDLIGCSFALHLCPESMLPAVCTMLAQASPLLLIVTPHKRPHIEPAWGWRLADEMLFRRVRGRLYRSDWAV
jgi:SAM-dependent methyltransferase